MHEWYLSVRHYFFSRCTKLYSISHFKESSPKEPATLQCMLVEIQSLHFKQLITITSKATHRTLNNLLKCIGYFAIRMRFRADLSCLNEIYFSLVERRPFAAALSTLNLFTLSPNSMTALWSGIRRTNASHRNRNNNDDMVMKKPLRLITMARCDWSIPRGRRKRIERRRSILYMRQIGPN